MNTLALGNALYLGLNRPMVGPQEAVIWGSSVNGSLSLIHKAFIGFTKRAEKSTADILYSTFVDSAPLFDLLATKNNQVMYGRRGTGKTHALKYLAQHLEGAHKIPVYIDLRSIGSDGALYHDISKPEAERSIRLILDVLGVIADELYALAVARISDAPHPDQITKRLDDLHEAISDVRIVGAHTFAKTSEQHAGRNQHSAIGATLAADGSAFAMATGAQTATSFRHAMGLQINGQQRLHIEFGRVQGALRSLLDVLGSPEIRVLIDEWSEIPISLQPYLADLLRRSLFPIDSFIVKIAAIEHRSRFSMPKEGGEYVGLELGADVSADLNLDDFLVFDNDQTKAVEFFKNLLFKHYKASEAEESIVSTPDELIRTVFTQSPVFDEFVRAVEGVPRDALNLAAKAATKAYAKPIAMQDVRSAARDWYQNDKAAAVRASEVLDHVLGHIVNTVIGERRARAFLFPSNARNEWIDRLFDARVIHLLKKNVSSQDEPGMRYDVFKIDYGCYVDLINTQRGTQGLFQTDDDGYVDVPPDDYRSIRRAILRPEELERFAASSG
jgi:hypothetical protein